MLPRQQAAGISFINLGKKLQNAEKKHWDRLEGQSFKNLYSLNVTSRDRKFSNSSLHLRFHLLTHHRWSDGDWRPRPLRVGLRRPRLHSSARQAGIDVTPLFVSAQRSLGLSYSGSTSRLHADPTSSQMLWRNQKLSVSSFMPRRVN